MIRVLRTVVVGAENQVHSFLVRHSIRVLRISIGIIFLAFGVLKYFPGLSPAQSLTEATTHILFFGLLPGRLAMIGTATLECAIGIILITGRGMRVAVYLLIGELLGILSPIVLLTGRLFGGPHGAPTLEGQYVLKDLTLVAAAMVVTAGSFRGGRLVRAESVPDVALDEQRGDSGRAAEGRRRLEAVLAGLEGRRPVEQICADFDISRQTYQHWCDQALAAATVALSHAASAPSNDPGRAGAEQVGRSA